MADGAGFQAQIASIIEILANSAVLEICRLVEDGYTALRARMEEERSRGKEEKEALRTRMEEMELKIRGYERRMRRRGSQLRMTGGPDDHPALVQPPTDASVHKPSHHILKVKQEMEERDDCNLDLKVEVNIRAECGLSTAMEPNSEDALTDVGPDTRGTNFPSSASQSSSPRTNAPVGLSCMPQGSHKAFKPLGGSVTGISVESPSPQAAVRNLPEIQTDVTTEEELPSPQLLATVACEEPSPERLNSLDLAWMQERVSHLGTAYAVTQLGLGNTESGHPSASFPSQGGDSLDSPPTVLFTGSAHEMAAFAASFDMAAAAAAAAAVGAVPPPAPPPTAHSASNTSPRQSYRSGVTAKEPMVCTVCGRIFPSASALELHQRVHTGERPYTCPHCGKGFAQPNNLRVHLLIHTGERRYRCTLCGKSFISSSHLKRHRTVHTQEKPYTCSRCGQSFSQMCSVRRHRQQSQCGL